MQNRMDSEQGHPAPTVAGEDPRPASSAHPQAGDYLESARPLAPGAMIPLAGFILLAAITAFAFIQQRLSSGSQEDATAPPASAASAAAENAPLSASFAERMAALEAAVAADPRDTLALAHLAEFTLAAHQPERALEVVDDWLAVAPRSLAALDQKAMAYAAMERWSEALEVNQRMYELDPTLDVVRLNMGAIYGNLGDMEQARRWFMTVVTDAPGTPHADAAVRAIARLDSLELRQGR